MNALDKVIGYFSPERAYRRARFRAATERFAYDGAKSGRRTDGWLAAGGDANTEVGASLISLRNPSRDLLRNNPDASKAITELVGNAVGIRRMNDLLDSLEIILDCDPRNVNDKGVEQPTDSGEKNRPEEHTSELQSL